MTLLNDSTLFAWGPGHLIYPVNGVYAIDGDNPMALLEIIQQDPSYWLTHFLHPVLAASPLISDGDLAIIRLIAEDPESMVTNVAATYPPPESFCEEEGNITLGDDGDGGLCNVCEVCGNILSELSQKEWAEAMQAQFEDLQFEAYRDEPDLFRGGGMDG